jgi:class 3 adenylate cyclase
VSVFLELIRGGSVERRVELTNRLELGRCNPNESMEGTPNRLIIAPPHQTTIPRRWFVVNAVGPEEVRIDNVHSAHSVLVEDSDGPIAPGESRVLSVSFPVSIALGEDLRLSITNRQSLAGSGPGMHGSSSGIRSLVADRSVLSIGGQPNAAYNATVLSMRPLGGGKGSLEATAVVGLLEKALSVVTAAAGSDKFLEAAVRAAVEIVGLDRAVIVGRAPFEQMSARFREAFSGKERDTEEIVGQTNPGEPPPAEAGDSEHPAFYNRMTSHGWFPWVENIADHADPGSPPSVSISVLKRVEELHKTQICDAKRDLATQSMHSLSSVVAAPILDRQQRLVAVLYGDRWLMLGMDHDEVTELEALLLDVLAGAVAGGIARQEEERSRAGLSEFFSPRVASMLVDRSDLLTGRDAQVSVLFCDVRGFSAFSEKFGARRTIAWINDVLTELSQCVVDRDGVLVDYVGDELFAMWGAPEAQDDHAQRALEAALEMLQAVDRLRVRCNQDFGCDLDVGIGINSGPARVGNVGSRLKFKYGVLGHTVNIGSRLQGACKHLGVRCIASSATVESLRDRFSTRLLAELRVAGISETQQVFECVPNADEQWNLFRDEYEAALLDFQAGRPGETVHRLGRLLQSHPSDRPSAILLGKAARLLTNPKMDFDTIWEMESK